MVEITFRLYIPYCAIHLFSPRWLKRSTEIPWTVHRRINAYFFLAMNINKVIEMGMSSSLFACWRIPLSSSSIPSSISPSLSSLKVLWKRPRSMSYHLDFLTMKANCSTETSTSKLADRRKAEVPSFLPETKEVKRFFAFLNKGKDTYSPICAIMKTPSGVKHDSTPL